MMTVYDLDDAQIDQLKETMWNLDDGTGEDLQETYEFWMNIPRCIVEDHYRDICFTEDDFWD